MIHQLGLGQGQRSTSIIHKMQWQVTLGIQRLRHTLYYYYCDFIMEVWWNPVTSKVEVFVTHMHTPPTCLGIQSEDTIYTRVYSVFVPAFKARTNLCVTHSKWGHFFTHLWTCLARTKRGLRPYPPTPILWKSEDSAHSHKARTEILTSLCQNVLTLNVKNWFWSSLWMPGRTHNRQSQF